MFIQRYHLFMSNSDITKALPWINTQKIAAKKISKDQQTLICLNYF